MRIGIMGVHYGHIGGMFRSAVDAPSGEIVGIVEPDDALYEKYAASQSITRYQSLDEMIDGARPDLVMEGLNHAEKADVVEACAAAKINILLDKPLCATEAEFRRIQAAVKANEIRLSMFFTSRSHPPFIALRDAILSGELGEIVSLISTHPHKLSASAPSWYFDQNTYAGTFHDLAGHGVDQVRWLSDAEYTGVHALGTCKKHPTLAADHVQASYRLSSGALAQLTADWLTPKPSPSFGDTRFIIMGTKGSAHLRAYAENHVHIVSEARGVYEPAFPTSRNTQFVENMINAFSRGEENFISTTDVLGVARACLAAEASARKGGEFLEIEND